jgi:adenylate kinase family enzyme
VHRVAILGSGGAGKSVLAAALADRTGLPVVHLDVLYWKPGWTQPPEEEFVDALDATVAGETWILDGNFLRHGTHDPRFARADTVIFLDLPRTTCLWRVVRRRVREARSPRRDLPEGCREAIDLEFMRWVWRYPARNRPHVLALLDGLHGVDVRHLRSSAGVRRYVEGL